SCVFCATSHTDSYAFSYTTLFRSRRWVCVHDAAILTRLRSDACRALPSSFRMRTEPMIRALLIASCLCVAAPAVAQDAPATPAPAADAAATSTSGGDAEPGTLLVY